MDNCGIYKITSPKNKVYIGQSENIENRWKNYQGLSCRKQRKLYNSLKKYGYKNHVFEIIENCLFLELNCRERYWQDFYDVTNRKTGLNLILTPCEDKFSVPQHIRNKISKSLIKYNKKKDRNIYQYDLYGKLIKIWRNSYDITDSKESFNRVYILQCCRKKHNKAYEFIWSFYLEEFDEEYLCKLRITKSEKLKGHKFNTGRKLTDEHKKKIGERSRGYIHTEASKEKISQSKNKPVLQYDKNMNFIQGWESAKQAGESLFISSQNISTCCRCKIKSAGGYIWQYSN